ncbi:uncharacterized protein PB18E9.04c-like [Etheostoma spectabile]|uniref:uncharacterized protein PB18E9.04c-like n=1 Tax=Etheostoma spectabile TaxID=54343 RepID=UPI0013AF24C7|nr:uncharacterized protein PB18E9.04c-like [Etheostoma spectabile]
MGTTRMFVFCVCWTFMLLGCTEEIRITSTNATVTSNNTKPTATQPAAVTTPLPGHASTHVTSRKLPETSTSLHNTTTITPSQQPTKSSGATPTSAATSASLFESCSQLLVPTISVLICGALA